MCKLLALDGGSKGMRGFVASHTFESLFECRSTTEKMIASLPSNIEQFVVSKLQTVDEAQAT